MISCAGSWYQFVHGDLCLEPDGLVGRICFYLLPRPCALLTMGIGVSLSTREVYVAFGSACGKDRVEAELLVVGWFRFVVNLPDDPGYG